MDPIIIFWALLGLTLLGLIVYFTVAAIRHLRRWWP